MLLLFERISREIIYVMIRLYPRKPRTHWSSILQQTLLCTRWLQFKASPQRCTGAFYMELGQGQGHKGHCGCMMIFFSWGEQEPSGAVRLSPPMFHHHECFIQCAISLTRTLFEAHWGFNLLIKVFVDPNYKTHWISIPVSEVAALNIGWDQILQSPSSADQVRLMM